MCKNCGCAPRPAAGAAHSVTLEQRLLAQNDGVAAHNRAHLRAHGVTAIHLMSSPGAGKTTLLEATLRRLAGRLRIAVIEGDLATENDARRIRRLGVPAVQITTGSACHLDAALVHGALHELPLAELDLLFIENVGNLVCPASFDLGQDASAALLSVTEGDDKPAKYPVLFRAVQLVLLTKLDLLAAVGDFSLEVAAANVRALANPAPVLPLCARTGEGLNAWLAWLEAQRVPQPAAAARAPGA